MKRENKNIEDIFSEKAQGFESRSHNDIWDKVTAGTERRVFWKFFPNKFNIYYLGAAISLSSLTTYSVVKETATLTKTETVIVRDTVYITIPASNEIEKENNIDYLPPMNLEEVIENKEPQELKKNVKTSSNTRENKEVKESNNQLSNTRKTDHPPTENNKLASTDTIGSKDNEEGETTTRDTVKKVVKEKVKLKRR